MTVSIGAAQHAYQGDGSQCGVPYLSLTRCNVCAECTTGPDCSGPKWLNLCILCRHLGRVTVPRLELDGTISRGAIGYATPMDARGAGVGGGRKFNSSRARLIPTG